MRARVLVGKIDAALRPQRHSIAYLVDGVDAAGHVLKGAGEGVVAGGLGEGGAGWV